MVSISGQFRTDCNYFIKKKVVNDFQNKRYEEDLSLKLNDVSLTSVNKT